jgi:DNA-binding FrmR family transcriptional regulator
MPVREKRKTAGAGVERVSEQEQGCAAVLHLIVAVRRGRELIDAL